LNVKALFEIEFDDTDLFIWGYPHFLNCIHFDQLNVILYNHNYVCVIVKDDELCTPLNKVHVLI